MEKNYICFPLQQIKQSFCVYCLQKEDIANVKVLLQVCYEYYHSLKLSNNCVDSKCIAPPECVQHNAVYNILHFLVDINFIKINVRMNF